MRPATAGLILVAEGAHLHADTAAPLATCAALREKYPGRLATPMRRYTLDAFAAAGDYHWRGVRPTREVLKSSPRCPCYSEE